MRSIRAATVLAMAVMATAAYASSNVELVPSRSGTRADRALAKDKCDAGYQCDFFYLDKKTKKTYLFNLNGLCSDTADYELQVNNQNTNGLFKFNICGQASSICLPYDDAQMPYNYGVAVQFWGNAPPTGQKCTIPNTDKKMDCTRECEVLGRGQPVFSLLQENDPLTGGLELRHFSEVAATRDNHECWDPVKQDFVGRSVTYKMQCDRSVPMLEAVDAVEHPLCQYTITMKSQHACGEEYVTSQHSKSGSSNGGGLPAGMFFLGMLLFGIGTASFWYYRHKHSGSYAPMGGKTQNGAPSNTDSTWTGSSTYQTGTGGIGSGI